MNQFQIIKRDKTWRDEKKMEKQTGWRGRRERFSRSPTWLLYLASCSLRLYKQQTWCELCQSACIYCLTKVKVQWLEVGCERFSTGALRFPLETHTGSSLNWITANQPTIMKQHGVLLLFLSFTFSKGFQRTVWRLRFALWDLQWAPEASTVVSHQRVWKLRNVEGM